MLDTARLGKQRVEALQVLRAIVLPSYGWQKHPAMQMWRGYVPALTRYSLDMVEEWTKRGHPDTTRPLIAEFAPEVVAGGAPPSMPSWLGNEDLHLSHRSNLVRKVPEFYGPLFPGVPDDLPYLWPGADENLFLAATDGPSGSLETSTPFAKLWILRPRNADEFDEWIVGGAVLLREVSPRGGQTPKWTTQLEAFAALELGTPVAVLTVAGDSLVSGIVSGPVLAAENRGGEPVFRLPVDFAGVLLRRNFRYPALLQDPRTLFLV